MKIATATPQIAPRTSPAPAPTSAPAEAPAQDQVQLASNAAPSEGKLNYKALAVAGGAVLTGAAVGVLAGLRGGIAGEVAALACIPGLAIGGALIGGVGFEKFGPSSSEYRAIGGMMVGGLVGAGAGITQAFLAAGAGSPALAATLGISGALTGAAVLFKAAAASH